MRLKNGLCKNLLYQLLFASQIIVKGGEGGKEMFSYLRTAFFLRFLLLYLLRTWICTVQWQQEAKSHVWVGLDSSDGKLKILCKIVVFSFFLSV